MSEGPERPVDRWLGVQPPGRTNWRWLLVLLVAVAVAIFLKALML